MEPTETSRGGLPPWNNPQFHSEQGLRDAQEYFFQTHATNSRLIAEGRNAQGFMKSNVRRKLNKEIGEDFKMYTGVSIGEAKGDSEESKGIRGELNDLLKNVYLKIAPTQPISSPIQEDLTILKHPLGGLEVIFVMSCYHVELGRRYASLAGDRRKVLKSVLDEEVFKWMWRMYYSFTFSDPKKPPPFHETLSSTGIRFVPTEKQRFTSVEKITDVGEFLLGKGLAQSHLRFPLCYYFVNFLGQLQSRLLLQYDRNRVEAVYNKIQKRVPKEPIDDVLGAVDFLMNTKGNSQQAFDDIVGGKDQEAQNFVPAAEIEFMEGFREFTDSRFGASLKKFIPHASKEEIIEGQGVTLMPLLLLLRTQTYEIAEKILEKMPGPFLSLMKNRIANAQLDDAGKVLLDRIEEMIKSRRGKGEHYTISSSARKVSSRPPTGDGLAAQASPAKPRPGEGAASSSAKGAAAGGEEVQAPAVKRTGPVLKARLIVEWRATNEGMTVYSLAPDEIIALVGPDPRLLLPWVLFALRTGQVFSSSPEAGSREKVEGLLRSILKESGPRKAARISDEERAGLHEKNKGRNPGRILLDLQKKFKIGAAALEQAGDHAASIAGLQKRLAGELRAFIMNPNQEGYRPYLSGLSPEEKQAVMVLNRVAKT